MPCLLIALSRQKSLCAINIISRTLKEGISENVPFMGVENHLDEWLILMEKRPFLSSSWKWTITLIERKLVLGYPHFPLNHDCGKMSIYETLDMDDTSHGPLPVESGIGTPSNYRGEIAPCYPFTRPFVGVTTLLITSRRPPCIGLLAPTKPSQFLVVELAPPPHLQYRLRPLLLPLPGNPWDDAFQSGWRWQQEYLVQEILPSIKYAENYPNQKNPIIA